MAEAPDVVYLVRPDDRNEELRFSLRSLVNVPHGNVWIAGNVPKWTNVGQIPVPQRWGKWRNQEANLAAACRHPDVSETFVLFNDDFFVVEPIEAVPVLHRGTFADRAHKYRERTTEYPTRMRNTAAACGPDGLCYDAIHVPMTFTKSGALDTLQAQPDQVLFRSMYGNRFEVGGEMHPDVKVKAPGAKGGSPFVSTSDKAFASWDVGTRIKRLFPDPCRYER